jgi:hypothetical protein
MAQRSAPDCLLGSDYLTLEHNLYICVEFLVKVPFRQDESLESNSSYHFAMAAAVFTW